ncbi:MAG: ribonuclease Z [Bacteroidales bacterium]|nr:ribonuclease Z [Bacteroidales bacterium]
MSFSITVLGSSASIPTSTRNPSGMVVKLNNDYYLVDCGEGTQMQLRRYNIKMQRINHIFISHLHGDHFFGLIGLISSFHLMGRKDPLHIYSDAKLREIIELQLLASQTYLVYSLIFHPLPTYPEVIYENEHQFVKSFPLDHRIPTRGFLFAEKPRLRKVRKAFLSKEDVSIEQIKLIKAGADYISNSGKVFENSSITIEPAKPRSFAYCSDTKYNETLIEHLQNATLLYHEASFSNDMALVADEKFHSTAQQAASIAQKSNVDQLLIGHFSARYKNTDELLREACAVFPNTLIAEDGMVLGIFSK